MKRPPVSNHISPRSEPAPRSGGVGLWHWDIPSQRVEYSPEWKRQLGFAEAEIADRFDEWEARVHPDDLPGVKAQLADCLAYPFPNYEAEFRMRHKDGSWRWFSAQAEVVTDREGKPLRMSGSHLDITARKRAELELRQANRLLRLECEVNRALLRCASEEELLKRVCAAALETGGYRMAWIGFAEEDEAKIVRPVARAGFRPGELEDVHFSWSEDGGGLDPAGEAVRSGRPCVARDVPGDAGYERWKDASVRGGYRASVALPLAANGGVLGVLSLYAEEAEAFAPAEIAVLMELARDLGAGLDALRTRAERERGTAARLQSERKLAEAERVAHFGYFEHAIDEGCVTWSDETYRIFGLKPQERAMTFAAMQRMIHPDDHARFMQEVGEALRGRARCEVEFRLVRPGGEVRVVRTDGEVIRDRAGRPIRLFGTVQDITRRKRAETALITLLDHFPDGVARFDRDCRYVYVNSRLANDLGFPAEQLLGRTPIELGLAGHRAGDEALESGIRRAIEEAAPNTIEVTWAGLREARHFEVRHIPERDESGRVISVLGIRRDVTKHRQAELGLQKVLRHARTIVMRFTIVAPEGWEQHGVEWAAANFRWTAQTFDEATAQEVLPVVLNPGEPYDRGWGRAKHPDDFEPMGLTAHRALISGEAYWSQQFRCIDRHGRMHWFSQFASIDPAGHGRWFVTTINTDFTDRKRAEDALHAREEEFRALVENSPDIICRYDRELDLTYGNPSFERLIGKPAKELVGKKRPEAFAHHAGMTEYYRKVRTVFETGVPAEHELYLDFLPGECPPIHYIRLIPERDRTGQVVSVLGIGRDVSAIFESEIELRASEERFATVFHTSPTAICIVRAVDDRFVDVNPAFVNAIGHSYEEIIGHTALDLQFWGDPAEREAWLETVRTKGTIEAFKFKGRRKDGAMLVGLGATTRIALNGEEHYLTLIHDITELEKAEAALRESEQRFRQVTENIDEVFWLTDVAKERMIYISPAYARVWGRTCDSLYAEPRAWLDAIPPEDRERVRQAALTRQATGDYDLEYRIVRPDGSVRWIHDRAFPIRDASGAVYRIAGVAEDVTVKRQLEEQFRQAQKMEAVGQLAGGIAHDFNNLLVVIQVQSSLLIEDIADARSREGVQQIMDAAERAANLTRQLLTFSRRDVKQAHDIDLGEVIEMMTKLLRRILGEDIVFETRFAPDLPLVNADPGMMEQVLMNLAVNARDAMPGGGRLTVTLDAMDLDAERLAARPQVAPGRFVCLEVSDTGCGIPTENMPRIFEPFFTTKDVGRGTGLGLATVFGIVQQHRGWIEVDSGAGRGTTFRVFFPARTESSLIELLSADAETVRGGSETVLLVEDDEAVRTLGRSVLERHGYRVFEADSAAAALEIWEVRGGEIDLLLTDLVMPGGLTGGELAGLLAARKPDLKILYSSGYSDEIVNRTLPLDPGRNFLQKPYAACELAVSVRRCLDGLNRVASSRW